MPTPNQGRAPVKQIVSMRITPSAPASPSGFRILVDAHWPADLQRDAVDRWIPELAPSGWLMDHFGRARARWGTFRSRYRRQLTARKRLELLGEISAKSATHPITLITAAPAGTINHARIIEETLVRTKPAAP
jgi:uncharacterized protein YeaO (DUF488 family)